MIAGRRGTQLPDLRRSCSGAISRPLVIFTTVETPRSRTPRSAVANWSSVRTAMRWSCKGRLSALAVLMAAVLQVGCAGATTTTTVTATTTSPQVALPNRRLPLGPQAHPRQPPRHLALLPTVSSWSSGDAVSVADSARGALQVTVAGAANRAPGAAGNPPPSGVGRKSKKRVGLSSNYSRCGEACR